MKKRYKTVEMWCSQLENLMSQNILLLQEGCTTNPEKLRSRISWKYIKNCPQWWRL